MSQHTLGPWKAGTKGFSFPDLRSWRVVPAGTRADQISEDDLRLIAAAPDLLAALELYLLRDTGQWEDPRIAKLSPGQITLTARAALAKAKGVPS